MVRASRKPTTVLLVRHGQTATTGRVLPGRAPGLHLSDDGRRQAEAAAQRIAKLKRVAAVYASPLERARETAMPIARARSLALRIERGLLELDVGSWTGSRLDRLSKRPEWTTVQRYPSGFRFPEGESFVEMQARVTAALARICLLYTNTSPR
jgi:broad specificity phosphatase PhoE